MNHERGYTEKISTSLLCAVASKENLKFWIYQDQDNFK